MSYGVGHRRGSDPVLLWLWHRWAAIALIQPLAWKPPYAPGVALKRPKKKKSSSLTAAASPLGARYLPGTLSTYHFILTTMY